MFTVYTYTVADGTEHEYSHPTHRTRNNAKLFASIAAEEVAEDTGGTGRAVVREADGMACYYVDYRAGYYRVLDLDAGDMTVVIDEGGRVVRPAEIPAERLRRMISKREARRAGFPG